MTVDQYNIYLGIFESSIQSLGTVFWLEDVDCEETVAVVVDCEADEEKTPIQICAEPENAWILATLLPLKVKLNSSLLSSSSCCFFEYEIKVVIKLEYILEYLRKMDWHSVLNRVENKNHIINFRDRWYPCFYSTFNGIHFKRFWWFESYQTV